MYMLTDNITTEEIRAGHRSPRRRLLMLWYGGWWLLLTLWLRFALPESLMGWERHQLFRFSAEYLTFFSHQPYPVLLYIQAFFTQFYLFPWLGAAVMGGLLTLGMGAWHRLTGRLWPDVVWVALLLPTVPYFNLLWILVWLVMLGGGCLIDLKRLPAPGRLGLTAGLAFIATFILHENIVLAIVFWTVVSGVQTRSWRAAGLNLVAGTAGAAIGIGLVFWQGYPFIYPQYLGEWPLLTNNLFILISFPGKFFVYPIFLRIWTYAGLVILAGLPFTARSPFSSHREQNSRKRLWIGRIAAGSIIAGLSIFTAYLNLHYQMEDAYLVDRLAGQGRWHEAAETADHAFFQRTRIEPNRSHAKLGRFGIQPVEFQDILDESYMAEMLKICLLASRQATNCLFNYNGLVYFPLLFPEDILHSPICYFMALYYTQNGFYAEALHILYDLVTANRLSTAVLEPILWNSVVVGDYAPYRKFIRFFEQSLFHRDIAHRYTTYLADTTAMMTRPEVAAARTWLSQRNHMVTAYHPDGNIYFRLSHESDNPAIYEYALALQLIYKNPAQILVELPKIRCYYLTLPTHIQEAILVSIPPELTNSIPSDISPNIITRYGEFLQAYSLYENGYLSFQKLRKGFEDTYWYHLYFNEIQEINPTAGDNGGRI